MAAVAARRPSVSQACTMDGSTALWLGVFALLFLSWRCSADTLGDESKSHSRTRRDAIDRKKGVTLTFAFDSTGSMSDELAQVKEGMHAIFKTMLDHPDKPIANYALVPFNDPQIGPVTITTNADEFNKGLRVITVTGGGDCPEMSVGGVKKALEISLPGSYIYVFTDASAKDHYLLSDVNTLIQRKKIQVVFVLTGDCSGRTDPGYKAYETIAKISTGEVFNLKKDDVKKVLKYVTYSVQERNKISVVAIDKPGPGKTEITLPVDSTMDNLTVSVSGKDPTIKIKDPHGHTPKKIIPILELPEAKVVSIPDPEPGNWSVETNSSSEHRVRVTAVSEFTFVHGFATRPTEKMTETADRPQVGVKNALLINVTKEKDLSHLDKLTVIDLKGNTILELTLKPVAGQPSVYKADMFVPPNDLFFLKVFGVDKKGMPIERKSSTAIKPQPPATPIVEMESKVTGFKNTPYEIKCQVESLVPFTAKWYKNGAAVGTEQSFPQSAEVLFHIASPTEATAGRYTCQAKNSAGTDSKDTQLTITAPPPKVTTPSKLRIQPGKREEVTCSVESELDYTVNWFWVPDSGDVRPVSGSRFTSSKSNTLIIDPVKPEDEGWYQCSAVNTAGKSEKRVFVEVREPVKVTVTPDKHEYVSGTTFKLSCKATGAPELILQWKKDGRPIEMSDPRVRVGEEKNTLDVTVVNAKQSDEGDYECEAANDVDKDNGSSKVQYTEKPTAEAVKKRILVEAGENTTLPCKVTGIPAPIVKWMHDGVDIAPGSNFHILHDGLEITTVLMAHIGDFVCVAENKVGKAEAVVSVEVATLPQFIKEPHDVSIDILKDGVIPCLVTGVPQPNVTWRRKDGRELDSSRIITGESCSLNISDASLEDEGTYLLKVENEFGDDESEATVTIKGLVPPKLDMKSDRSVSVVVGTRSVLTCPVLEGYPPPVITWSKDGELLDEEQLKAEAAKVQDDGSLVIAFISPGSRGAFECVATNAAGKARRGVRVTVLEPPSFVRDGPVTMKVKKNKDIRLPCIVQGKPKPTVTWTRDGKPVIPTGAFVKSRKDDSLLIKSADETANGTYECIAANSAGTKAKTVHLFVKDPPHIAPNVEILEPIEDEHVPLHCEVTAFPKADIQWLQNGVPLTSDTVEFSDDNSTIRFTADSSYSGRYECIATNDAGTDKQGLDVIVMVPPSLDLETEVVVAKVGQDLTLNCYAKGTPVLDYTWAKYGSVLEGDIFSSTYTVRNVQPDATGAYECQVYNDVGDATKIIYVKVHVPPKISFFPEEISLVQGNEFILPCSAEGTPTPKVVWKKDGVDIPESDTDEAGTLILNSATLDDNGIYTCVVENSEGKDQRNLVISVLAPPVMEDLESSELEVSEAQNLLISCPSIKGHPPPTIHWLKDGRLLNIERMNPHISSKDSGRALRLRKATAADAGEYSCIASNPAGRTRAVLTVIVRSQPKFNVVLPHLDPSVVEGSSVTFDCSVTGNPLPKVTWLRDGHPVLPFAHPDFILSPNNQVLHIPSVKAKDEGQYQCRAENKVGNIHRTYKLDVYILKPEVGSSRREYTREVAEWLNWSEWSPCSASCGKSERVRVRRCADEDIGCSGNREQWRKCIVADCMVNGGWGKWSKWTSCSASCASGERRRYRKCNNPTPRNHGEICSGSDGQTEKCNEQPCSINGGWTEWSDWEACRGLCSSSTRERTRLCTEPAPMFGGTKCEGESSEHEPCALEGCPVNGQWSDWSEWSPCSATCGPSTRQRLRNCSNPEAKFGGAPCRGISKQTEVCEKRVCDNIPIVASIRVRGTLNGESVSETLNDVSITDLEAKRTVQASTKDILKRQPGWYPYLSFLLSPVIWLTAFQKGGASNGHTLTSEQFKQTMYITFDSGEKLKVTHTGYGLGSDGTLKLQVDVNGNIPIFPLGTAVSAEPYEEDYIQTTPNELYAEASTSLDADELDVPFFWNKTISYSNTLGAMPFLVQTLSVWDIEATYNPTSSKLLHKSSAVIGSKAGGDNCLEGFIHNHIGHFCEDIRECADRKLNRCHFTQLCEERIGSYECTCPPGLQAATIGAQCLDIDECLQTPPICSHHCQNTEGSFKCLCPPGLSLLDDATNCSDIFLISARSSTDSEEVVSDDGPLICRPGYSNIDGICQETDPCKSGPIMCSEDEKCVKVHGLYRCVPTPCSDGYSKDPATNNCIMRCDVADAICDTGATVMQTLKHVVLTPETSGIHAYRDLTSLPVQDETGRPRPHTSYSVLENEEGKPFRVKMDHDEGILYSQKYLSPGKEYKVTVLALSYDDTESVVLYATKFIVLIHLPEEISAMFGP